MRWKTLVHNPPFFYWHKDDNLSSRGKVESGKNNILTFIASHNSYMNGYTSFSYCKCHEKDGMRNCEKNKNTYILSSLVYIYNEINCGKSCNCPVSSPISICQDCSNERCKITSALPGGDISCSINI